MKAAIGIGLLIVGGFVAIVLLGLVLLRALLIRHIEAHGKDGL